MKAACPRRFEAEAMRDGRLVGAEVTSFERHLTVCPVCAREVQKLHELGDALCTLATNDEEADELRVRRERTRLLAAFDATLVLSERPHHLRTWVFGLVAVSLLSVGMLVFWRARDSRTAMAIHPVDTDAVIVHADSTALWSKYIDGPVAKIVLERGALAIHVDHTRRRGRLVVALPDGELEDMGTTFTVSADAGRTTRVTIQEGSVVLRIHGLPPVALSAGDTWSPAPPTFPSVCASCVRPLTVNSNGRLSLPAAPRATMLRSATAPPDSSIDFRAAMTALDRGDSAAAAMRFAEFLKKYPGDARAEDAAYLQVIAFQRARDAESMNRSAREYLRRYPAGFRRAEVEGLSR
jgi:hypothetical protein